MSDDKKESTENTYPLKEEGIVYANKSAGKDKESDK